MYLDELKTHHFIYIKKALLETQLFDHENDRKSGYHGIRHVVDDANGKSHNGTARWVRTLNREHNIY
jgi:hypothetical protein